MPRPPWPPSAGQPAVAGVDEVGQHRAVLVADDGALGHRAPRGRRRAVPCLLLALAVGAAAGPAVGVVAEGEQRGHVAVGDEPDVAAVAAVAAVGAALGDVGLAPERDAARAAVAALHVEAALVDELRHRASLRGRPHRSTDGNRYWVRCTRVALDAGLPGGDVAGDEREKLYWIPHQHEFAVVSGLMGVDGVLATQL